jgi:broad specificity phosphatase PhoE
MAKTSVRCVGGRYNRSVDRLNLYLIRHGETEWNQQSRLQGHTDVRLSEEGLRQSELVAERFRGTPADAVYSSDLLRAMQTAEIVGRAVGLEVIPRAELREANFGSWEGRTRAENERDADGLYDAYKADPMAFRPPGGEAIGAMIERVWNEFERIGREHPTGTVVLVTSGGPIKGIALRLLRGTSQTFHLLRTDNTGVSLVQRSPDGAASLTYWNDSHHLGPDGVAPRITDALLRGRY